MAHLPKRLFTFTATASVTKTTDVDGIGANREAPGGVLVDAHVHLHACFEPATFFNHAATNFKRAVRGAGAPQAVCGCLMLTESAGDDQFAALRAAQWAPIGRWRLSATQETCSLWADRDDGIRMAVIAGRQIVTKERLEVLALGTTQRFEDGQPIDRVIEQVLAEEALAVLPWGFGKWTGRRGCVIRRLLESSLASRLFVGDNSGRLRGRGRPAMFELAEQRGVPILPGSDPLPFAHQVSKPGRYGFTLPGPFDPQMPAESIKRNLAGLGGQPPVFGQREGLLGFVRSQVAAQVRRRLRESRA